MSTESALSSSARKRLVGRAWALGQHVHTRKYRREVRTSRCSGGRRDRLASKRSRRTRARANPHSRSRVPTEGGRCVSVVRELSRETSPGANIRTHGCSRQLGCSGQQLVRVQARVTRPERPSTNRDDDVIALCPAGTTYVHPRVNCVQATTGYQACSAQERDLP